MEDRIREILAKFGRFSVDMRSIGAEADLYNAGLSSLATVNVMLAIEEEFGVEFPDRLLTRRSFQSVSSLTEVVEGLRSSAVSS